MAFDAKFDKLVIDSIDTVTALDRTTSEIVFIHDEIKNGTIENGGDLSFGTGAHGRRVSTMQSNKTAKLTYTNAYVVASSLAAKVGANIELASAQNQFTVPTVEFVKVESDGGQTPTLTATLSKAPVTTSIKFAYIAQADMTAGTKLTVTTDFSVGDTDNKVLTITNAEVEAGDTLIVCYDYTTSVGKKISNDSDKYSKNVKLIVDMLLRDVCDNSQVYHARMVFFNAVPDMNNTITIGDEPAVEDFSAESIVDPCSVSKLYWDMYIVE